LTPTGRSVADESSFLRAIELSALAAERFEGGPIGAVVARDGLVLGEGNSRVVIDNDPTQHAEIVAIRAACRNVGHFRLAGADLYTTCEPCPMCLAACYWAGIERVFYACSREDSRDAGFLDAWLYEEMARPREERRVDTIQAFRDQALPILQRWTRERTKWYSRIKDLADDQGP
jgi:tRNA(Arg) A34 adenosine deaminase TadA